MSEDSKKKYYHDQRVNDEKGMASGNRGSAFELAKIREKLGDHPGAVDAGTEGVLGHGIGSAVNAVSNTANSLGMGGPGPGGVMGAGMGMMGKMSSAAKHPIDAVIEALEAKLPGVTAKIEHAIGSHHEELGGSYPFKRYSEPKALGSGEKNVTPKSSAPKALTGGKPGKTKVDPGEMNRTHSADGKSSSSAGRSAGVKPGHKPKVGGDIAKPGPKVGKTAAAPKKAPARTSTERATDIDKLGAAHKSGRSTLKSARAAAKNPYSAEGIAAARGKTPSNVKRQKKGV